MTEEEREYWVTAARLKCQPPSLTDACTATSQSSTFYSARSIIWEEVNGEDDTGITTSHEASSNKKAKAHDYDQEKDNNEIPKPRGEEDGNGTTTGHEASSNKKLKAHNRNQEEDSSEASKSKGEEDDDGTTTGHEKSFMKKLKAHNQKEKSNEIPKPKRPLTAYLFFTQEMRPRIKQLHPSHPGIAVTRELGRIWASLDFLAKYKYKQLEFEARKVYIRDMKKWKSECDSASCRTSSHADTPSFVSTCSVSSGSDVRSLTASEGFPFPSPNRNIDGMLSRSFSGFDNS